MSLRAQRSNLVGMPRSVLDGAGLLRCARNDNSLDVISEPILKPEDF